MIRLRALHVGRPGGFALHVAALDAAAGERLALVGPSGAGKSTLLALLAGLVEVRDGTVEVAGLDLARLAPAARRAARAARIGYVAQDCPLLGHLTVAETLALALRLGAAAGDRSAEARAAEIAERLGLGPLLGRRVGLLSAGERQRAALLRALGPRPRVLLADEPTAALDAAAGRAVAALLADLARGEELTVLAATHDPALAGGFDRTADVAAWRAAA